MLLPPPPTLHIFYLVSIPSSCVLMLLCSYVVYCKRVVLFCHCLYSIVFFSFIAKVLFCFVIVIIILFLLSVPIEGCTLLMWHSIGNFIFLKFFIYIIYYFVSEREENYISFAFRFHQLCVSSSHRVPVLYPGLHWELMLLVVYTQTYGKCQVC